MAALPEKAPCFGGVAPPRFGVSTASAKAAAMGRAADAAEQQVAELERAADEGAPDVPAAADEILVDIEALRAAVGKLRKGGASELLDAVAVRASTVWARAARVRGRVLIDLAKPGERKDLQPPATRWREVEEGPQDAARERMKARTADRYRRLARVPADVFAQLLADALEHGEPITQGRLLEHAPRAIKAPPRFQPNHKIRAKGSAGRIGRAVRRVRETAGERSPPELRAWIRYGEELALELFRRYAERGSGSWKGTGLDVLEALLHAQHAVAGELEKRCEERWRDEAAACVRALGDWRERFRDIRELRATGPRPAKDDEALEAAALVIDRQIRATGDRRAQEELRAMAEEVRAFAARVRQIREGRSDPQGYRMPVPDAAGGKPSPGVAATPFRFGGPGRG